MDAVYTTNNINKPTKQTKEKYIPAFVSVKYQILAWHSSKVATLTLRGLYRFIPSHSLDLDIMHGDAVMIVATDRLRNKEKAKR